MKERSRGGAAYASAPYSASEEPKEARRVAPFALVRLGLLRSRACRALLAVLLLTVAAAAALRTRIIQALARARGERSVAHRLLGSSCLVDELLGHEATPPAAAGDHERFLLYAPQFGLGNQQITLRNAVVWALLLNRTLVIPHIVTHAGCSNDTLCAASSRELASHGDAFDVGDVSPLRFIEMRDFVKRGEPPAQLLVLPVRALWAYRMTDDYWPLAGLGSLTSRPPLEVTLRGFDGNSIRSAFGACGHHRALAFRSLFAALDLPKLDFPHPGIEWLDSVAMPRLYRPTASLAKRADEAARALRAGLPQRSPGGGAGSGSNGAARALACVHIRVGDIVEDCARYEAESKSSTGRGWVRDHFRNGFTCFQPMTEIAANLQMLIGRAGARRDGASWGDAQVRRAYFDAAMRNGSRQAPVAIYAAIEDASYLRQPLLAPFNVSTLTTLRWQLHFAMAGVPEPALPAALRDTLLDQMICARSDLLVLNIFSTFSQMMLTRIGLDHPERVGWARDFPISAQRALGIEVDYWRAMPDGRPP